MTEGWDWTRPGDTLHYFKDDLVLCRGERYGLLSRLDRLDFLFASCEEGPESRKCKNCLRLLVKAEEERMIAKEAHRQVAAESAKLAQEFMDRLTGQEEE